MKTLTLSFVFTVATTIASAAPGFLGILLAEVDAEIADTLNLPGEYGARVGGVMEDSAAEEAGMKDEDVIIAYNGQRVEGAASLQRMVRETPAGRTVQLDVIRNSIRQRVSVELGEREMPNYSQHHQREELYRSLAPWMQRHGYLQDDEADDEDEIPIPPNPPKLGIAVQPVSEQLAQFLDLDEEVGLWVGEVDSDGRGDAAGLQKNDIILAIDDEEVSRASEITRALLLNPDDEIELLILRNGKEKLLTVEPLEGGETEEDADVL